MSKPVRISPEEAINLLGEVQGTTHVLVCYIPVRKDAVATVWRVTSADAKRSLREAEDAFFASDQDKTNGFGVFVFYNHKHFGPGRLYYSTK